MEVVPVKLGFTHSILPAVHPKEWYLFASHACFAHVADNTNSIWVYRASRTSMRVHCITFYFPYRLGWDLAFFYWAVVLCVLLCISMLLLVDISCRGMLSALICFDDTMFPCACFSFWFCLFQAFPMMAPSSCSAVLHLYASLPNSFDFALTSSFQIEPAPLFFTPSPDVCWQPWC